MHMTLCDLPLPVKKSLASVLPASCRRFSRRFNMRKTAGKMPAPPGEAQRLVNAHESKESI